MLRLLRISFKNTYCILYSVVKKVYTIFMFIEFPNYLQKQIQYIKNIILALITN
jgi:hypothetical protein